MALLSHPFKYPTSGNLHPSSILLSFWRQATDPETYLVDRNELLDRGQVGEFILPLLSLFTTGNGRSCLNSYLI